MMKQYLQQSFTEVWELLWEIPAPKFKEHEETLDKTVLGRYILVMFPLLGVLAGLGVYLLAWGLKHLPVSNAATFIFAVSGTLLLEIVCGGRGLSTVAGALESICRKEPVLKSLFTADSDIHAERGPVGLLVMFIVLLLRAASFALLFNTMNYFWFMIAFAANYALQAHLAALPSLNDGEPFIDTEENSDFLLWGLTAVIAVIIGRHHFAVVLAVILISAGVAYWMKHSFKEKVGGMTGSLIGGLGYTLETLLLLVGAGILTS